MILNTLYFGVMEIYVLRSPEHRKVISKNCLSVCSTLTNFRVNCLLSVYQNLGLWSIVDA